MYSVSRVSSTAIRFWNSVASSHCEAVVEIGSIRLAAALTSGLPALASRPNMNWNTHQVT